MSNLDQQIKEYLKQDKPDYFVGLELYAKHTKARKNVIKTCELRSKHGSQQQKIIYELERCIGAKKYSGRKAVVKEMPQVPFNIIKETTKEAPEDYNYSVKYEDLPEDLKKLVIEKGEAYNKLNMLKKEVAATKTKNDEKSVAFRQQKYAEMQKLSERIKEIHGYLTEFESPELQEKISERNSLVALIGEKIDAINVLIEELGSDNLTMLDKKQIEMDKFLDINEKLKDNEDENSIAIVEENEITVAILSEEYNAIKDSLDSEKFEQYNELKSELNKINEDKDSVQKEIDEFHNSFNATEKEVQNPPEEWNEETLNAEYKYLDMSWAEKKILYKDLQSSVAKQLQRAKNEKSKEKTRRQNALKAARGGAMLDILKAYFDKNPEAPE